MSVPVNYWQDFHPDDLLTVEQVLSYIPLSERSWVCGIVEGKFPKHSEVVNGTRMWLGKDILALLDKMCGIDSSKRQVTRREIKDVKEKKADDLLAAWMKNDPNKRELLFEAIRVMHWNLLPVDINDFCSVYNVPKKKTRGGLYTTDMSGCTLYIWPEYFRDTVCEFHDYRKMYRILQEAGMAEKSEKNHVASRATVPVFGRRAFFIVKLFYPETRKLEFEATKKGTFPYGIEPRPRKRKNVDKHDDMSNHCS